MTNMVINIGLQVTEQTPINKGDFEQWAAAGKGQEGGGICPLPWKTEKPEFIRLLITKIVHRVHDRQKKTDKEQ